ncbi:propionyl-CoA--succinate CoA transferase [Cupriavidus sp. USMAA2-4]|uniref:Propionyl-CoA--succinate CoA transferase n=1 Tax=Cupriavidus malaysiensis TaxID=367825 RepID=A0ABM6F595_9BURK|nr:MULTISPECIES: acetyl-CoA hydrolase/transferase family protein [Cupriavidus]AOY93673.1 propionyl-CoA--succinate CoA transferase [Cupriavidus sp. USMAA2-4]AOZ00051.1 propionyl-CoA--succinate CoA transferase [Cupriavidus sp. USMAHM13]AOZ06664.1 propionyl-CoA--succinate CoA transferase [Cupriavidus malaysiensis]
MYQERIRLPRLHDKVMEADEAAKLIRDGMVVGMSGFTRAGDCKAVPFALARRAADEPFSITLMTGASLGNDIDKVLSQAGVIARRLPFQSDETLRRKINAGEVMFIDQHLSETVEQLRGGQIAPIDVAVVEAAAITEQGGIVPTTSVGNSASFAMLAKKVIVEINLNMPLALEGLHDIAFPVQRPHRQPIPLISVDQRIGLPYIPVDPEKIAAIVITAKDDSPSNVLPPDAETRQIAGHLIAFLDREVRAGRLSPSLQPLQAGIGTISNAVLHGLIDSPFSDLKMYSEVLQDSTIELLDAGRLSFASASSVTLSRDVYARFLSRLDHYRSRVLLRPQEISNHPEVIRRLGLITINTALECDIYGNVNSTHVLGTHMMNGIGGSGDFARNAHLSVFVTKSIAKGGNISSVVPMVAHVDHTEHDVDIIVTEHGLADLRGLAPRERAREIINHCADPLYRDALRDYVARASVRGGQTPHLLEEAFAWHLRYRDHGSMREDGPLAAAVQKKEPACA